MTDTAKYNSNNHEHYDHQNHLEAAYRWLDKQETELNNTDDQNPNS